jgi:hypothetical protein
MRLGSTRRTSVPSTLLPGPSSSRPGLAPHRTLSRPPPNVPAATGLNSYLEFIEKGGRLVATTAMPQDPVDTVYGIIDLGRPTDAMITRLRGRADAI